MGPNPTTVLITGGSGYFGEVLATKALAQGDRVRIFDLNAPSNSDVNTQYVHGDIRDFDAVRAACDGIDVVYNNVAQVPLARDREQFDSVNVGGTANLLVAAREAGVTKIVHTSSSAVFGIPERNPVTEQTEPRPLEAYGRAKLRAEVLCHEAAEAGTDVTIIRPRTILGHGRLGLMAALFELVADGAPVFVFGSGANRYQFVHADDLAAACIAAGRRPGWNSTPAHLRLAPPRATTYNIGSADFGTMRETLTALVEHAATGSRVLSLPLAGSGALMAVLGRFRLAPFAPYHALLYGQSLYFDITKATTELGWHPTASNASMIIESYDWFLAHREELARSGGRSAHQSLVNLGVLKALKAMNRSGNPNAQQFARK